MDTGIFIGDKIITTSWDKIWDKPNTLSGYGITDAVTIDTAQEIYGIKTFKSTTTISTALDVKLILQSLDADNYCMIKVQDQNSQDLSYIGYLGNNWYTDGNLILNSGNYTGELDNRYVNKAGDTMTGNLVFAHTSERPSYSGSIGITFREQIANGQGVKLVYNDYDNYRAPAGLILVGEQGGEYFEAPAIYQNGYKVWDAGNKRGMFSSMNEAFTAWGNEQVINVEGDANTYYPVVITIDGTKTWNSRISIYKNLGSRTPSYPGNHSNGTSSMWAMYEGRYSGWDGNSGYIVTKYVRQPYANLISKAERAGNAAGKLVVYLRGGGCEYRVCTDYRAGVSVYYERTEISGDSNYPVYVEPTMSVGNRGVLNLVSYDYLVQKAVRLETPRYIFSKPFDGTGNVTGGAKFTNICIETDNNGNDSGRGGEIDNYVGPLQLQQASPNGIHMCVGGGQVGICTTSPKYTLHVDGVIYAKDGFREKSDIREKKVLNSHTVSLDDMAYADLFDYTLIDDEKEIVKVGTNAHYWLDKLPQVVTKDNDEYLSLNYGVLGTVCALSVSKYVKQLEDRVTLLENKIASLQ